MKDEKRIVNKNKINITVNINPFTPKFKKYILPTFYGDYVFCEIMRIV